MAKGPLIRRRDMVVGAALTSVFRSSACRAQATNSASLLDYLPPAEHPRIASGRSELDCAPFLQRAVRETAASGAILRIPLGTYMLSPAHELEHADPNFACLTAVRMVSGMRLQGESGALLRMVPGFSSDAAPRAMAMFAATEPLADIELRGLVLDMNGRHNPISPERASRIYNRLPQAQIFVSSRVGRAAARIDRVQIADTVFRDANGVSCIVMAQTEDRTAPLGRQWTLERCSFIDNGLDTDDHSSIFAYAEDVKTTHCTFANTKPFGPAGVNTAYEVHGARQRIRNCTFTNMMRGIWVANNYSRPVTETVIANNAFQTMFYGVDFFHDRATAHDISGTRIVDNRFTFDDTAIPSIPQLNLKAAVQVASEFGQREIHITGNFVSKTGHTVTGAFLVITGGASGSRRHDAIVATGNSGRGLTFGSFVRTTPTAGLGRLVIVRNRWSELAPSSTMAIAAGDAVEHTGMLQPIEALTLGGGSIEPGRDGDAATKVIYINALVRSLVIEETEGYEPAENSVDLGGAAQVEAIERHRI